MIHDVDKVYTTIKCLFSRTFFALSAVMPIVGVLISLVKHETHRP